MSLFVAIQGSAKPASATNPSVVVIGAGTTALNGIYTPRGESNGKPYYNLEGQPDSLSAYALSWDSEVWRIVNEDSQYAGEFLVGDFPWNAGDWIADAGAPPAPLVYESGTVPNVLVAGAGSATSNGTYVFDEASFGLGDSGVWRSGSNYIFVNPTSTTWYLYDFDLDLVTYIESSPPNASPWANAWAALSGDEPAPTVTEV